MTHDQAVRTMASERYLLDEMSELERYQFEAHYFDCLDCAEDVRLGAAIRDEVKAGSIGRSGAPSAAETGEPAAVSATPGSPAASSPAGPARTTWRRASVVLPWAAAAALAVIVGYQAAIPGSGGIGPQAVSPVMLRGVSRGADPVVTVSPDEPLVAVTADVLGEPGTRAIAYELLDPASSAVISGRTTLPAAGAPLLLLIPADRLTGPGAYVLVVRDADRPDTVLGEYRFAAQY